MHGAERNEKRTPSLDDLGLQANDGLARHGHQMRRIRSDRRLGNLVEGVDNGGRHRAEAALGEAQRHRITPLGKPAGQPDRK